MTTTFKNKSAQAIGTTVTDLYTVPASTTASLISLCLANITDETIFVDVKFYDGSALTTTYIVKEAPVIAGGSFIPIGADQKIILETTDKIQIISDTASSVDALLSLMEIV